MLRIGLTGGIGAGKSAACRFFTELGVPVIDADQISREVVEPGGPALVTLREQFGPTILTSEGTLDRGLLRTMIFAEPALRQKLEAILHPLIKHAGNHHAHQPLPGESNLRGPVGKRDSS